MLDRSWGRPRLRSKPGCGRICLRRDTVAPAWQGLPGCDPRNRHEATELMVDVSEMPRMARRPTGWLTARPLGRRVLHTTAPYQEDAFGWFDYISEIKSVGVDFLRARGHTSAPIRSFYLFQSFIRQAKTFYRSAVILEPRSSPLNYYYAFLNLAKTYILVNQPQFTGKHTGHGLASNLRPGGLSKQSLTLAKSGVFANFYRTFSGLQLTHAENVQITVLLAYCSDISTEYVIGRFGKKWYHAWAHKDCCGHQRQ